MKNFLLVITTLGCVIVLAAPQTSTLNDDSDEEFSLNPDQSTSAAPQTSTSYDDGDEGFSLDPVQSIYRFCQTARDMRDGICVDEGTCSEALNIEINGIIDESDLRIGTCAGEAWCCVHPNMSMIIQAHQITPPPPQAECRTGLKDSCPWCVGLYRNNPRTKAPQLFCGGAIIGSRLVLTAASCALTDTWTDLWVQLPGRARKYTAHTAVRHRQFHSGTGQHDVALLLLNEDIEWPEGLKDNLWACLGLRTPLLGDCIAIGFDDYGHLKFTSLTVKANSCSRRGSTFDAACGRAISSGSCSVAPGSPVLCPYGGSGDWILAGLVRQICMKDSTLLGSIMASADWIRDQLTNFTLAPSKYSISH